MNLNGPGPGPFSRPSVLASGVCPALAQPKNRVYSPHKAAGALFIITELTGAPRI